MSKSVTIPKIQDLVSDPDKAFKNDQLKVFLNQSPPNKWVLKNKLANDSDYVPIDKVEYLLDVIFQSWKVEVLDYKILFNAISVSVRLHYLDTVTGEWRYHDGVGAKELQTKKDAGSLKPDGSNVNRGAVEMALPIAKTMAIKDAADHIGKIFGRDLNRKNAIEYTPIHKKQQSEVERARLLIQDSTDLEMLQYHWNSIGDDLKAELSDAFDNKFNELNK